MTLDKVSVDIGPKEMAVSLSYVALNRVRTLEGLMILEAFDYRRLDNTKDMLCVVEREKLLLQMEQIDNDSSDL